MTTKTFRTNVTTRTKVIRFLRGRPGELFTAREIAERLGMNRGTVCGILSVLNRARLAGFVHEPPAPLPARDGTGRWGIVPAIAEELGCGD